MQSVESAGYFAPGLHEAMAETKAVSLTDGDSGFFEQLLDIVNPLQHIPVVSTVYRALTGDEIAAPARLIGGALFGGPVGFATATANLVLEDATGSDLAGHALALVSGLDDMLDVADATPPIAAFSPSAQAPGQALAQGIEQKFERELAQQAVAPATTGPEAADSSANVIWNGPRVLPSLARAAPMRNGPGTDGAVDTPNIGISSSNALSIPQAGAAIEPDTASAETPVVAAQPAWLGAAIADAQAVQDAAQLGQAAQKVQGQPWVTEAMFDALNKYETLARERIR